MRARLLIAAALFFATVGFLVKFWKTEDHSETVYQLQTIYSALVQASQFAKRPIPVTSNYSDVQQSWRVVSYNWITANEFWNEYEINQPFDSPKNSTAATLIRLSNGMPFKPGTVFASPEDPNAHSNSWTSYLRITGERTLGEGFSEKVAVADGADKTILLVFLKNSKVLWTSPIDLNIDKDSALRNQWMQQRDKIVLFADGRVRLLSPYTTLEQFTAMCTCDGGEFVDLEWHKELGSAPFE